MSSYPSRSSGKVAKQSMFNFDGEKDLESIPNKIGHADVSKMQVSSILTKASGFMNTYDFTLNPYSGCTFGCVYCYAAAFARDGEKRTNWGKWVDVKENALSLIRKQHGKLKDSIVYMSSVTDPYQPVDRVTKITRELIKELFEQKAKVVIQTRSPLVKRDADILAKFKNRVQVNMTVTTDSEKVRKQFEPTCSSNEARLGAIKKIADEGIPSCITMTPLLPVEDPLAFADKLLSTGVQRFIIQPFHEEKGRFIAGTREGAMSLIKEMEWSKQKYEKTRDILRTRLPQLGEGKEGFAPPM